MDRRAFLLALFAPFLPKPKPVYTFKFAWADKIDRELLKKLLAPSPIVLPLTRLEGLYSRGII